MTKTSILEMVKEYAKTQDLRIMNDLIRGLEEDIRTENNKANGKSNVAKAIKAITGSKENTRDQYKTAWLHNGRITALDGYRMITTSEPVNVELQDNAPINVTPHLEGFAYATLEELETPSIGDLKTKIAMDKAEGKKGSLWIWGDGSTKIAVNTKYLLDMLTADPFATIRMTAGNGLAPIYFNDPDALVFGIILPVRITK